MPIRFDPKESTSSTISHQNSALDKPKEGFLKWAADAIYDGYQKEQLPSEEYCKRAWLQQKKDDGSSKPTQAFMRQCMNEVESYKSLCRQIRRFID